MALRQIEPRYLDWVHTLQQQDPQDVLNVLKKDLENLNGVILRNQDSDEDIQNSIKEARKRMLYASLVFNEKKLDHPTNDWKELDKFYDVLKDNMQSIENYEQHNILSKQEQNIDLITWIGLVFLPLTLITGYYGMNFGSMGAPSSKVGPFSWKYGQTWVLVLFFISLIISFFLFKRYSKRYAPK